jgi:hypothetical protein
MVFEKEYFENREARFNENKGLYISSFLILSGALIHRATGSPSHGKGGCPVGKCEYGTKQEQTESALVLLSLGALRSGSPFLFHP